MNYTTELTDYDDEHLLMPIPDELLRELNWKEGDTVIFKKDRKSDTVTIALKNDSESNSNAT
ncbi:MAG: AbrB/MazE/SpoVT family DNA-binding domain-containing protein [Pseudomonadota bacterium]